MRIFTLEEITNTQGTMKFPLKFNFANNKVSGVNDFFLAAQLSIDIEPR